MCSVIKLHWFGLIILSSSGSNTVDYYFYDNFVNRITEANRSILGDEFRVANFRDEGDVRKLILG